MTTELSTILIDLITRAEKNVPLIQKHTCETGMVVGVQVDFLGKRFLTLEHTSGVCPTNFDFANVVHSWPEDVSDEAQTPYFSDKARTVLMRVFANPEIKRKLPKACLKDGAA